MGFNLAASKAFSNLASLSSSSLAQQLVRKVVSVRAWRIEGEDEVGDLPIEMSLLDLVREIDVEVGGSEGIGESETAGSRSTRPS